MSAQSTSFWWTSKGVVLCLIGAAWKMAARKMDRDATIEIGNRRSITMHGESVDIGRTQFGDLHFLGLCVECAVQGTATRSLATTGWYA